LAASIVTEQVWPSPEHAPVHPAKREREPLEALAFNVTIVPGG
jgi:hypothetical protein